MDANKMQFDFNNAGRNIQTAVRKPEDNFGGTFQPDKTPSGHSPNMTNSQSLSNPANDHSVAYQTHPPSLSYANSQPGFHCNYQPTSHPTMGHPSNLADSIEGQFAAPDSNGPIIDNNLKYYSQIPVEASGSLPDNQNRTFQQTCDPSNGNPSYHQFATTFNPTMANYSTQSISSRNAKSVPDAYYGQQQQHQVPHISTNTNVPSQSLLPPPQSSQASATSTRTQSNLSQGLQQVPTPLNYYAPSSTSQPPASPHSSQPNSVTSDQFGRGPYQPPSQQQCQQPQRYPPMPRPTPPAQPYAVPPPSQQHFTDQIQSPPFFQTTNSGSLNTPPLPPGPNPQSFAPKMPPALPNAPPSMPALPSDQMRRLPTPPISSTGLHKHTLSVTSSGSVPAEYHMPRSNIDFPQPPYQPDMQRSQAYPNNMMPPSRYDQSSAPFRTPGSAATISEWSRIKTPIALMHERHLLPSDGEDVPVRPAISSNVNCDPDIARCTLTNIPSTSKLLGRCRLPLGLIMHPFRDLSNLHTINSSVIVRCRSCRTYINPFAQFLDSGRRWRCPVCFLANTVPDDFFYDPTTQTYGDPARRPEIRSATIEFIAPSEYMLRPPQPATYLFCFDVSRNAISTGYLRIACQRLEALLDRLPGDSRRQIAFITYDSGVQFYKLCGDTIRMLVCPDRDDVFLPDYDGLLNRIDDNMEPIREFLRNLPESFATTCDTGNCLGSALQASLKLIGNIGGRISVFNTCLPNLGSGALKTREEPSDRVSVDVKHLGPSIDFYKTFALDCAAQQVAVDLFVFNSQYCDIATISGAARFSSGTLYHYPDFFCPNAINLSTDEDIAKFAESPVSEPDGKLLLELDRFRRDFDRYLTRKIGFEAVMRIRCTHGLTIQAFHGSFFVRSTDLMSLPNVNPDAGFAVQLDLTENVEKYTTVCCQIAILYTSAKGDRRIRVHTLCLPVVHTPAEVFHGADQGAIVCLLGKMAVDRTMSSGLSNAREALSNAVADALSAYASNSGYTTNSDSSANQLLCPASLRLLALYICGLLRYRAFRVGVPTRLDDRCAALETLKTASPDEMLTLLYPRLYAAHRFVNKPLCAPTATLAQKAASLCLRDHGDLRVDADRPTDCDGTSSSGESDGFSDIDSLPAQLHLTAQNISRTGVYLLDTGELLLLLVGSGEEAGVSESSSEVLRQLLGISSPNELNFHGGPFCLKDPNINSQSDSRAVGHRRLASLISFIRLRRPLRNTLVCMRHDAPSNLRTVFLSALIEDRTESAPSYPEFLQMVQTLIKS